MNTNHSLLVEIWRSPINDWLWPDQKHCSPKSKSSYSPTWLLFLYTWSPGFVIWGWKPWLLWNKKSLRLALFLLELRWGTLKRCCQLGLLSQLFGEKNEGTWEWFNCMDCNDSLCYWFHIFKESLKWLFLEWTTTTTSISVNLMVSGEDPVLLGGIHLEGKWQILANEVLRGQCWIQRSEQCGWLKAAVATKSFSRVQLCVTP